MQTDLGLLTSLYYVCVGEIRAGKTAKPTYTSPKPTLTLTSYLGRNVGLGEGWVGSF